MAHKKELESSGTNTKKVLVDNRRDYQYYAKVLKPELKQRDEVLYDKVLSKGSVFKEPLFGVIERRNYSKQTQLMRDPDASQSFFDDNAFKFYMIKYGEILGLDAMLISGSHDRKMSYD